MEFVLRPHKSVTAARWQVTGALTSLGKSVQWDMRVEGPSGPWHTDQRFGADYRKNWELWNFDVVEAFLQPRAHQGQLDAPYLEVQISPLRQVLALVILKPREKLYTPLEFNYRAETQQVPGLWQARMELQLPAELAAGELHGGLFACLGAGPEREYHALNPNPEPRPDYHRPELFQRL